MGSRDLPMKGREERETAKSVGFQSPNWLYNFSQITFPFWASVSSSRKGRHQIPLSILLVLAFSLMTARAFPWLSQG